MKNKKTSPKEVPLKEGASVPGIQLISKTPDSPPSEPERGAPVPGIQPISPKPDSPASEPQNTPSETPTPSPPSTEPSDK